MENKLFCGFFCCKTSFVLSWREASYPQPCLKKSNCIFYHWYICCWIAYEVALKSLKIIKNPLAQVACLKTLLYIRTPYISWNEIGYNCSPKLSQASYLSSLLVLFVPGDFAQEMARILPSTTSHQWLLFCIWEFFICVLFWCTD